MGNTKSPLSIFIGQQAAIRCVTNSHGAIRPNMVDGIDFTPKITGKEISEFDNLENALIYTTFDGVTGKIAYLKSNLGQIESLMMDTDPTVDEIWVNPTQFKPFTMYANLKGPDGKVKGSYLCQGCLTTGNPFTSTTKEAAKETIDFMAINIHKFNGYGILYSRIRANTGPVAQPGEMTLGTSTTGGYLVPGTYYVKVTAVTATGESIGGLEAYILIPTGTSTNKITVTTPAPVTPIATYNVYCSEVSNGERYSGNDGGTSTYVITVLPASTATLCPTADNSGAYEASGDIVFSTKSALLNIPAVSIPQTGLPYALVMKNGIVVADPVKPASGDDFYFTSDGKSFEVGATPAVTDWWDVFTVYKP